MKVGYIRVSTEEQNTARQEVLMEQLGVEFVSRKESIDSTTPAGKFMLTVFASVADIYSDIHKNDSFINN